jgi:alanyl-tRNA synthetase
MTNKFYLDNPYLKEIDARVIDKTYEDGKYYIKLNRTIFYPHLSGGQPGDKGTINGIEVLEVYEEDLNIIHVVKENIHSDKVKLSIIWENRIDNMQQHTGQHLLSSSFYKLYNGETIGFHIGGDYVYIDVNLPDLSKTEVEKIEIYANKIISLNFPIKSYIIGKNDIDKIPVRKQPTVNSNIRIVEIENIDFSPCAGTHLRSTGEIGLIKIRKWEKYKGNTRIEFVCGNRALHDYGWKNDQIKDISLLLSSKDIDAFDKVKKLYLQKEELEKENRLLKDEVYEYRGKELLKNSTIINSIPFIIKTFDNKSLSEISGVSNYLNNSKSVVQIYGSTNSNKAQFMVSKSKEININLQDIFKLISSELELQGGGSPNSVQGSCSLTDLEKLMEMFLEKIKEVL